MPNGAYKGQKLMKLVSNNTAATTKSTVPKTPEIMFVKNNVATTAAISILTTRSIAPKFFFMGLHLIV